MSELSNDLMKRVRARFAHVDRCPVQGERIFFENAGGALTLNSVVETARSLAAMADNQGRDNPASQEMSRVINEGRQAARLFLNAPPEPGGGRVIVGESGTELLFRLIMNACLGHAPGVVLGSTLEHPATRSACRRWARIGGHDHVLVRHDDADGTVGPQDYGAAMTPEVRVATIVHASPVTGMRVDVAAIAAQIRQVAPACTIIVDGIQHAAHGQVDLSADDIDGYVISPYKVFARHGFGLAWISDRLARFDHDGLEGAPAGNWELGTRDAGAYACFSQVVSYLEWLGAQTSDAARPRARIEAAGRAIHAHEKALVEAMIHGTGNLPGLADIAGLQIIGGAQNPAREGLVSFAVDGMDARDVVAQLNENRIRTHMRSNDHYSGNVLDPLGLDGCVRVSLCHYNSMAEVSRFLGVIRTIVQQDAAGGGAGPPEKARVSPRGGG